MRAKLSIKHQITGAAQTSRVAGGFTTTPTTAFFDGVMFLTVGIQAESTLKGAKKERKYRLNE